MRTTPVRANNPPHKAAQSYDNYEEPQRKTTKSRNAPAQQAPQSKHRAKQGAGWQPEKPQTTQRKGPALNNAGIIGRQSHNKSSDAQARMGKGTNTLSLSEQPRSGVAPG